MPKEQRDSQHSSEDEGDDHGSRLPGLGVATPLKAEDEAGDGTEDEGSAEPVHVQHLLHPSSRCVLLGLGPKWRRSLQEESDGDESDCSDREVDVEAL